MRQSQGESSEGAWTLQAACWSPSKGLRSVQQAEIGRLLRGERGLLWVDLHARDLGATQAFLVHQLGFHPLAVEDALSPHERPALHEYDQTLFLEAHPVLIQEREERYLRIGFFVGKHFLVTVHTEPVPLLTEWFDRWCSDPATVAPSSAILLHLLLDAIVDDYFPVSDLLQEAVDALEEQLFDKEQQGLATQILAAKRRWLVFRQHITPLRDILNALLRRGTPVLSAEILPYLQDVYDHTLRLTEIADLSRDVLAGVLDAHLSIISNRLNDIMRVLTVIATLLMSMGFIASIYGMNFAFMPELRWQWGYPFALGLMTLVALLELLFFRRKGWI